MWGQAALPRSTSASGVHVVGDDEREAVALLAELPEDPLII